MNKGDRVTLSVPYSEVRSYQKVNLGWKFLWLFQGLRITCNIKDYNGVVFFERSSFSLSRSRWINNLIYDLLNERMKEAWQINMLFLAACTFGVGLALGILRKRAGGVLPPVAAHVLFDIMAYGEYAQAPWWVWSWCEYSFAFLIRKKGTFWCKPIGLFQNKGKGDARWNMGCSGYWPCWRHCFLRPLQWRCFPRLKRDSGGIWWF